MKDILFEGIDVWCNSTTFAVKAVCLHYKQKTPGTVFNENGYYKFSLLGPVSKSVENNATYVGYNTRNTFW